jgi:small multidrug resistance family-3 protein
MVAAGNILMRLFPFRAIVMMIIDADPGFRKRPQIDVKYSSRKKGFSMLRYLIAWAFLIGATSLESTGDALVRIGLFERAGTARIAVMACGGVLLFGYGLMLNLAPLPFERVVGLYIATLFLVWQIVSFFTFRTVPGTGILVGGSLIVLGGLVVTFWAPK